MTKRQYKFFEFKKQARILKAVFRRFGSGEALYPADHDTLFRHGMKENFEIKFYDQDDNNFVSNLITVVGTKRIDRIPGRGYSLIAIKVLHLKPRLYKRVRISREMIDDKPGMQAFLGNVFSDLIK